MYTEEQVRFLKREFHINDLPFLEFERCRLGPMEILALFPAAKRALVDLDRRTANRKNTCFLWNKGIQTNAETEKPIVVVFVLHVC
jgi:hypothetical protein